ncbi:MAG: 3-deoxy-7-phosphoheptulonate synthase [Clostridia bacterium]
MFKTVKRVITPDELKKLLPITAELAEIKLQNDNLIKSIISGKDKRFLIVTGPCSADNIDAVMEYCIKLKVLSDKYIDKIVIMPRVFTAKPRTTGEGYLGMMYQPDCDIVDIDKGVYKSREMMIRCIKETGMAISDELLYPEYYDYFDDLISYYFIGARSSENPEHRNIGSGLDMTVGVKNGTGGNLISLAGAVYACQRPKEFLLKGVQVKTEGNLYAHAVFRGFVDESGVFYTNYSENCLNTYGLICDNLGISNKSVLVDRTQTAQNKALDKCKPLKASLKNIARYLEV